MATNGTQEVLATVSLPVAADYKTTSKKFYLMDLNTSGQAVLVSAAGQRAFGVLDEKPTATAAGTMASVRISGKAKVVAGDTVDEGYDLTSDSSGRVVQRTSANQALVGRAVTAGVVSDVIEVELTPVASAVVLGSDAIGDTWYKTAAATWSRLAIGAANTILSSSGTAPQWSAPSALLVLGSDAAGDLLYKSNATTLARLPIGTSGQTLTVSSAATPIPAWEVNGPSTKYCYVFEDFLGNTSFLDVGATVTTGLEAAGPWATHETETTGNAVVHAVLSNADDGQFQLGLSTDNEVQVAWLGWDDVLNIPADKNPIFECRLKTTAAAGAALDTTTIVAFGLQSARNDTIDSVADHATIRLEGTMDILLESDDQSADNDDKDSTIDLVDNTFYEFKIDASDPADVTFWYRTTLGGAWTELTDGVTTFTLRSAANLQPYFQIQKSADTNDDELYIDYVKVYWDRS